MEVRDALTWWESTPKPGAPPVKWRRGSRGREHKLLHPFAPRCSAPCAEGAGEGFAIHLHPALCESLVRDALTSGPHELRVALHGRSSTKAKQHSDQSSPRIGALSRCRAMLAGAGTNSSRKRDRPLHQRPSGFLAMSTIQILEERVRSNCRYQKIFQTRRWVGGQPLTLINSPVDWVAQALEVRPTDM